MTRTLLCVTSSFAVSLMNVCVCVCVCVALGRQLVFWVMKSVLVLELEDLTR